VQNLQKVLHRCSASLIHILEGSPGGWCTAWHTHSRHLTCAPWLLVPLEGACLPLLWLCKTDMAGCCMAFGLQALAHNLIVTTDAALDPCPKDHSHFKCRFQVWRLETVANSDSQTSWSIDCWFRHGHEWMLVLLAGAGFGSEHRLPSSTVQCARQVNSTRPSLPHRTLCPYGCNVWTSLMIC